MRVVLILDGPEVTVAENEDDIGVFIVETQNIAGDERYAKDVWNSFPADLRHYVEDYMEPEWVEEAKEEREAELKRERKRKEREEQDDRRLHEYLEAQRQAEEE